MLECGSFYKVVTECGIRFFAGVPDSLLKNVCAYITDHVPSESHVIAANEGGAVGLAIGHYLSSGEPGLVYMQNSGQGNAINPLASLADIDVYGIPMLLLVGWRGEPGVKDEPQHVKQGKITEDIFETLGINYSVLPQDESSAERVIQEKIEETKRTKQPVALLVRKNTFSSYTLKNIPSNSYSLTREEAIQQVVNKLNKDALVVSTTGKPSRELFEIRDLHNEGHHKDFLTVGGMGHASQIALGIALNQPTRMVCCLDGDGAMLMHTGGMGIIASQKKLNYKHILLNNGAHESVGGQPTVGFSVNFCAVAEGMGYSEAFRVDSLEQLEGVLPDFLAATGPVFLEICIAVGSREDLGRPTVSPSSNKIAIMGFLND